ncbi:hypothetical protein [Streptomyces phaeochromogenes]|uniref:hypothetical protein n=1 Tax=Streptomyces phaeochromogenes TaxID=1923 RepID=UPI0036D1210D
MPLLLALAAEASTDAVGWAAVGLPQMGALAAEAAGLDLASGMRIDDPGRNWAQVLATVAEAVPVVLVGPLGPVPDRIARRLAAVLRRSGSILPSAGSWQGAEARLQVISAVWEGVGNGHGLLRGRRVKVAAAAPRPSPGMPRCGCPAPTASPPWCPPTVRTRVTLCRQRGQGRSGVRSCAWWGDLRWAA